MTALNQDFDTYAGDAEFPIVTVTGRTGAALDLTTASDIVWTAYGEDGSAVLQKSLQASSISFVSDGTDGKFQILIATGDTSGLCGLFPRTYAHAAKVLDASAQPSTVMTGKMTVKPY